MGPLGVGKLRRWFACLILSSLVACIWLTWKSSHQLYNMASPGQTIGFISTTTSWTTMGRIFAERLSVTAHSNQTCYKDSFSRLTRKSVNFNCSAILEGNALETARAGNVSGVMNNTLEASDYINMISQNCSYFRSVRGYVAYALSEDEVNFPLAFSILMYRDVEQSERLLRAIYQPQNTYCIHVDNKSSDAIYNAMSNISSCFNNVYMSPIRYTVKWGTMTVLQPEVACMKLVWETNKKWKYFINLTGQEFPLKTNYELVQSLRTYNGTNIVELSTKYVLHVRQ